MSTSARPLPQSPTRAAGSALPLEMLRQLAEEPEKWWRLRELGGSSASPHHPAALRLIRHGLVDRKPAPQHRTTLQKRRLTGSTPRSTASLYRINAHGLDLLRHARRAKDLDAVLERWSPPDVDPRVRATVANPLKVQRHTRDREGRISVVSRLSGREVLLTISANPDEGRMLPDCVAIRGTNLARAEARFGRAEEWLNQWSIYTPHITRAQAASLIDALKFVGARDAFVSA